MITGAQYALLTRLQMDRASQPDEVWVEKLRAVGFFAYASERLAPPPELPNVIRLYRGAPEAAARGLWWGDSVRSASEYADFDGPVWTALVPRDAVLGMHRNTLTGDMEYIVDLPITAEVVVA